jgi:N-acetyltransferase
VNSPLHVPTLSEAHVRLEPLSLSHVGDLVEAANEDRSSYHFTVVPETTEEMTRYVEDLLALWNAGEVVPFVQIERRSARANGATRFLTIRRSEPSSPPYAIEIGGTWLAASAQRSAINTEAKLLLLTYAFETLEVERVDLKTDARNERSRLAIERLGATFEGVLRRWQPSQARGEEGKFRDSALYSVVREEWPAVRHGLRTRLDVGT